MKEDIYDLIKSRNEKRIKEDVIKMLQAVVDGDEDKNEISYYSSYFVTVPLELGWKDNYKFDDKVLEKAIMDVMSNFEGDTEEEAKEKARKMIKELEASEQIERIRRNCIRSALNNQFVYVSLISFPHL